MDRVYHKRKHLSGREKGVLFTMEIKSMGHVFQPHRLRLKSSENCISVHVAESLGVPVEIYDFTLPDVRKKKSLSPKQIWCSSSGTPVISKVTQRIAALSETVVAAKFGAVPMVSFATVTRDVSSNCGTSWKTTASYHCRGRKRRS